MSTCKACGIEKPQEEFYKTSSGKAYPYCKECWSIDMRRRFLERKKGRALSEDTELEDIMQLYDCRRAAGLQNPGDAKASPINVRSLVATQLQMFKDQTN